MLKLYVIVPLNAAEAASRRQAKPPLFFKILGGSPKKIFKIFGVPLIPKLIKNASLLGGIARIDINEQQKHFIGWMVQWYPRVII